MLGSVCDEVLVGREEGEGDYEVKNWHTRVGTDREGVGCCL